MFNKRGPAYEVTIFDKPNKLEDSKKAQEVTSKLLIEVFPHQDVSRHEQISEIAEWLGSDFFKAKLLMPEEHREARRIFDVPVSFNGLSLRFTSNDKLTQ